MEMKELFKKDFADLLKEYDVKDLVLFPIDEDGWIVGYNFKALSSNNKYVPQIEGFLKGASHVLTRSEIGQVFEEYREVVA